MRRGSGSGGDVWLAYWNEQYDRHHYYNPSSGETSWVMPDNFEGGGVGKGRDFGFGEQKAVITPEREEGGGAGGGEEVRVERCSDCERYETSSFTLGASNIRRRRQVR